ncbi:MAG: hypothetical protein JST73_13475, partial [Actinobacteria bacterium]|nr:hypothetical protein [Actinomycetota bacterium]
SMGAALLVSPWNPDVAIIPFFLAIVCAWAVGEGDPSSLVPLVVAVSYSVQSHAGYIGISMIVLAAPAVALMVRHRRRSPSVIRRHHRPIITAAVVAIGLWLPPLVQQLRTTPGNVTLLWQASGSRSGPAFGMRNALRVMAAGLLPGPGRWLTVHADIVGLPPSVPTPWLVGILLATATLGTIAAVRGHRRMFGFMVFVVALDLAGIVSIANIRGPIAPYLIGWIMPVSILTWISIFASASAILGIARARRPWYALGMSAVVLAAMLVPGSIGTEPASPRAGTGIAALGDEVAPKLSTHHRYLLEWTDDQTLSGLASGFIARLESHGIVVLVDDTSANVRAFGASRVDNQPTRADMVLRVRGTSRSGSLLMPHAGEQIILRFDERDPSIPARIAVLRPRLARLDALAGAMTRREVASGTPLEQALIDAAARYPEINVIAKELNALTGTGSAYLVTTRPID